MSEEKLCLVCGNIIKRKRNKLFCSYKCAGLYRQNYSICPICGETFKHSPSDVSTHTCGSAECRRAWRAQVTSPDFYEKSREALKTSPNTGHFETHHAAIEWRLMSPEGQLHEFRNIVLWAEQHEDLLPVSPRTGNKVSKKTFIREIQRLKSSNEKYTYFREDYHGWRVIKDSGNTNN